MISVSTCWRSAKVRDGARLVEMLVEAGARTLELEYRITGEMLQQMKPVLAAKDVGVSSVHNFFPVPDVLQSQRGSGDVFLFSSDDASERELAVKYGVRSIETAADVGARAVVFHLSKVPMPNGTDELRDFYDDGAIDSAKARGFRSDFLATRGRLAPKAFDHVLSSLDKLLSVAQKYGVVIGVENRYHPNEIPDFSEIGRILETFEGAPLGYWHDVGHAEVQERFGIGSQQRLLEAYGDKMVGIHVHDVVGHDDHWAPGTGEVDFAPIARHVPADALVVIEAHSKVSRDELAASIDFVRKAGLG